MTDKVVLDSCTKPMRTLLKTTKSKQWKNEEKSLIYWVLCVGELVYLLKQRTLTKGIWVVGQADDFLASLLSTNQLGCS